MIYEVVSISGSKSGNALILLLGVRFGILGSGIGCHLSFLLCKERSGRKSSETRQPQRYLLALIFHHLRMSTCSIIDSELPNYSLVRCWGTFPYFKYLAISIR